MLRPVPGAAPLVPVPGAAPLVLAESVASPVRRLTGSWQPAQRRWLPAPALLASSWEQKRTIGSAAAWAWALCFHPWYSFGWQLPQKTTSSASCAAVGCGPAFTSQLEPCGRSRATTWASDRAMAVASAVGADGSMAPVRSAPLAVGREAPLVAQARRGCRAGWKVSAPVVTEAAEANASSSPSCPICALAPASGGVSSWKKARFPLSKPSRWQPPHDIQLFPASGSVPFDELARKKSVSPARSAGAMGSLFTVRIGAPTTVTCASGLPPARSSVVRVCD